MRVTSLATRLLVLQLFIAATAIILVAVSTAWLTEGLLSRQEEQGLVRAAEGVASHIGVELVDVPDLLDATRAAMDEGPPSGYEIDVLDRQGRVVFSSSPHPDPSVGATMRKTRTAIAGGGWVIAMTSTAPRHQARSALLRVLTLVSLTVLVLTFIAGRILTRRELAPLARLADQADQLAHDMRIRPLHRDGDPLEVGTVAAAFDRLLARLEGVLESERNFTRDAAHELRTPLTVISGEIEYTLDRGDLGDSHRARLESARAHARTLWDLVDALLFLRRVEGASDRKPTDRAPVNLADVVRELVPALRTEAPGREGDLEIRAPDEALVTGSEDLLAAAARNLIENAFKFTEVRVPVRVSVTCDDRRARLLVEDGGAGIPPGESERVFDPFYRSPTVRANRPGFGLGLSLARRIARAHGGEVSLSRSDLGGAAFELWLPALGPGSGRGDAEA